MFSSMSTIDTAPMITGAMNLFDKVGMPLLLPIGGIMMGGLVIFVTIAALKSILS